MDEYSRISEEVASKTGIPKSEIFNFDHSPYKEDFKSVFEFYQETLILNAVYGIHSGFFIFNTDRTINASAARGRDYYIINFNCGTIVGLIEMFRNNDRWIIASDNSELLNFEKKLDNPISEIMYQNAIHYTFYHELAHLIQQSEYLEAGLAEKLDDSSTFSERKHILELDADQFSAIKLGIHMIQYSNNLFGSKPAKEDLEKLVIIICTSVFVYLMSFQTNKLDIYYNQNSHPHPIVRITLAVEWDMQGTPLFASML